jgi:hypothetical protein
MSLIHRRWHISSFSGNGGCVEVRAEKSAVLVRHSKRPDGPVIAFTQREWLAFLAGVRNAEFDLLDPGDNGVAQPGPL